MQIYLTLDYELFLRDPGSDISKSLLFPTEKLNSLLSRYGVPAIYFVDAGYLTAIDQHKHVHSKLRLDYEQVRKQLDDIQQSGHELALHIHPHWEDSFFDGNRWQMDLRRFKLADFTPSEAEHIFRKYYSVLQSCSTKPIVSHRSGGWCLEPFFQIKSVMQECGIYIDSTVYENGHVKTDTHSYDFRRYPKKDFWRFSHDPSIEDPNGYFIELPGASTHLGPPVFWKILLQSLIAAPASGVKGKSVKPSIRDVIRKLSIGTVEPISIDSVKSHVLLNNFKKVEKKDLQHFCVIGHPKCFTEDTFLYVQEFIEYALAQGHVFTTFQDSFTH